MRKRYSLFNNIVIFVLTQFIWLALVGIWIYWYVSNNIVFNKVGDQISPQLIYDVTNIYPFVGGIILLVILSLSIVLIFRHLNVQIRLTRLYDNFIANVTHELKSPLSSIQLYLETLNSRNVPPEKQKEFYNSMIRDADRLKRLIDSILGIAAQEKRKAFRDYQVHNADQLFEKLLNETLEQFRLDNNAIKLSGKANCECLIDKGAMRIVFDNIIDNAVKYSISPLFIDVNIKSDLKKVHIMFKDNGIGILKDEQKKIFNKFYRIYDKEIPNVKGTGLGLFWVKEIIKNHKGRISVYSEGKNKGSVFIIELPVFKRNKKNEYAQTQKDTSGELL